MKKKDNLFQPFIKLWWLPVSFFLTAFISSTIFYINQSDIYRTEAVLSPVNDADLSSLGNLGSLGGLASVAGINLGSSEGNKSEIALRVLKSKKFLSDFIEENQLKATVFATKGWDLKSNTPIYDNNIFENGNWTRDVKFPKSPEPSGLEVAEHFLKNNLKIHKESDTGFLTITIDFYSPDLAKDWIYDLVDRINKKLKQKDITQADGSLKYLEETLKDVKGAELRNILFGMIEEQHKKLMLANINDNYVFEIISHPLVPEESIYPKRAIMVLLISFVFTLLGFYLAFKFYRN